MFSDTPLFHFTGPFGIRVEIGQSLVGLVLLILLIGGGNPGFAAGLLVALLLAVTLHEYGHAWACRVQGVPVRRIMIYGGGGFCERAASVPPRQEEFIVMMGPIVNLALWAVAGLAQTALIAWLAPAPGSTVLPNLEMIRVALAVHWWLGLFGVINLALFLFNLIPVQPLDGGKLLQLGLARVTDTLTATRIAGMVGVVFAVLWIPGLIAMWFFLGWILFFLPSIGLHLQMARAGR